MAVARALVSRPRIVFADEPTGNLDSQSGAEVLELLRRSVDEHGQTVVMVTHDPVAAAYTDRVVFLADGRVVDELRDPSRETVLEADGEHGRRRPARPGGLTVLKVALKSLLGRKVRLLHEHVRDRARGRVRGRLAGLLRHAVAQLHRPVRLDASATSWSVPRAAAQTEGGGLSALTVPGSLVDEPGARCPASARVDGNVNAFGVYVVDTDNKVVGGLGPPAIGSNWTDAPAAGGEGLEIVDGRAPEGADEVLLDESTAERAGYAVGDTVPLLTPRGAERLQPTLVGIAGFPERRLAQRRDAGRLRHRHRAGPVPRRRGRLQRPLGDRRGRRLPGGARATP